MKKQLQLSLGCVAVLAAASMLWAFSERARPAAEMVDRAAVAEVRGGAYGTCARDILNDCEPETVCTKIKCTYDTTKKDYVCSAKGEDKQSLTQWNVCRTDTDKGKEKCTPKTYVCSSRTPCQQVGCTKGTDVDGKVAYFCIKTADKAADANKHDGKFADGADCPAKPAPPAPAAPTASTSTASTPAFAMLSGVGFDPFD